MTQNKSTSSAKKTDKKKTKKKQADGALRLQGDCTIYESAALKTMLLDYISEVREAEIDMSGVKSIDASFMQLLLATDAEVRSQDKTISFSNLSDVFTEMATLLHAEPLLAAVAGQHKK